MNATERARPVSSPGEPGPMRSLVVEVTRRCNHDCRHCYNVWKGRRPYPAGELSAERLLSVINKATTETGIASVTITGGEPLLRPDLAGIVEALASRGLATTLITNGTLVDRSAIAALVPRVGLFELPPGSGSEPGARAGV